MGQEIAQVKQILRQQMRAVLEELSQEERAESDQALAAQFLQHPKVAQCTMRCLMLML